MKYILSQGGEEEHVSFCTAMPSPQREFDQLLPVVTSIHNRTTVRYASPQLGVQLVIGTQLVHKQTIKDETKLESPNVTVVFTKTEELMTGMLVTVIRRLIVEDDAIADDVVVSVTHNA
ncbi:unnamed protein product [Rotaria sp. Silwood1]|nr:unnamed protein product [Rotaria sp. Silwood1]